MAQESGAVQKRLDIPYFEGVNSLVGFNVGKKTEFVHAENARSKIIGTIEKREGQETLGTNIDASANYGLFEFENDNASGKGLFRISKELSSTVISIYYLNLTNLWIALAAEGTNLTAGNFSATTAEGNLFLANLNDNNRYVKEDGLTVVDSTDGTGHLFNSPNASKVNYYKSRLYLADFTRSSVRYPTTILRSSYALGILALVNDDVDVSMSGTAIGSTGTATIPVTDNKYFYTDTGANLYDIYRGPNQICSIQVTQIDAISVNAIVTATSTLSSSTLTLLASDEIWISGTYTGEKVFRWINNPTIAGTTVKQYDTFKLSGGNNSPITMMLNIGNIMLVGTKYSLASWNDYVLQNFDLNIGNVSQNGYIKVMGTLYFLSYDGIYQTTGDVPKLISTKVQRYITGATKAGKEASAAGKKGTSIFFSLGDVTLYHSDGSVDKVLPDTCLEYNTIQQNWFVHTNVKADHFETYIEALDTDKLMLTDDTDFDVKEFLTGELDGDDEIPFRIDTMKLTLQPAFENLNNIISVLTDSQRGAAAQVFVDLDNGEGYYPLPGNIHKGLSNIKVQQKDVDRGEPPATRLVSVSIRDSSKQIFKLSRMSLIFTPTTNDNPQSD